ncbi:hypothetical protein [Haloarchaeobius salinus]|uniref:hypothetical protein n=1 Tax=Haloarchaeobius salinus TaxID=1198298 RepID=UPI00210C2D63|nr:hypothetical protein [Haloarchaeobius salinus]
MREEEPIKCGICGKGILETAEPSGPKEGTEKMAQPKQAWDMKGSNDLKREAEKAWALKIGFCDNHTKKHGLNSGGNLNQILPKVSLQWVARIPEQ